MSLSEADLTAIRTIIFQEHQRLATAIAKGGAHFAETLSTRLNTMDESLRLLMAGQTIVERSLLERRPIDDEPWRTSVDDFPGDDDE